MALGQGHFNRVVRILDQLQLTDLQSCQVAAVGSLDDGAPKTGSGGAGGSAGGPPH
jgi:hypothetical protein